MLRVYTSSLHQAFIYRSCDRERGSTGTGTLTEAICCLSLDGTLGNSLWSVPGSYTALMYNGNLFLSRFQSVRCQEGFPLKCAQTPTWYLEATNWDHLLNLCDTGLDQSRQTLTQPEAVDALLEMQAFLRWGRVSSVCYKQNNITYTTCMEWSDRGEKCHLNNFLLTADEVNRRLLRLGAHSASEQHSTSASDPENATCFQPSEILLHHLHWLPGAAHIRYKTQPLTYKVRNWPVHTYLKSFITPHNAPRSLWYSDWISHRRHASRLFCSDTKVVEWASPRYPKTVYVWWINLCLFLKYSNYC